MVTLLLAVLAKEFLSTAVEEPREWAL